MLRLAAASGRDIVQRNLNVAPVKMHLLLPRHVPQPGIAMAKQCPLGPGLDLDAAGAKMRGLRCESPKVQSIKMTEAEGKIEQPRRFAKEVRQGIRLLLHCLPKFQFVVKTMATTDEDERSRPFANACQRV